jgi:hypothetical protein
MITSLRPALSRPKIKIKKALGYGSMEVRLPSICEVLGSILSKVKKQTKANRSEDRQKGPEA